MILQNFQLKNSPWMDVVPAEMNGFPACDLCCFFSGSFKIHILVYIVYILYHGLNLGYITFTDIWEKNRTIYQKSIIVRQCKKLLVASSTCANSPSENCSLFPLDYDIIEPSWKVPGSSIFPINQWEEKTSKIWSDQIPSNLVEKTPKHCVKKKLHLGSFPTKKNLSTVPSHAIWQLEASWPASGASLTSIFGKHPVKKINTCFLMKRFLTKRNRPLAKSQKTAKRTGERLGGN